MIRVLIVDDFPEYRELLTTTLELDPEIFVIGSAGNGLEALSFCETASPDLVLMDFMMPVCDGGKGTTLIKERFPWIKVLIMTGLGNEHNLPKALAAGADGYLLKLLETPMLPEVIKNTMKGIPTIGPEIFIP